MSLKYPMRPQPWFDRTSSFARFTAAPRSRSIYFAEPDEKQKDVTQPDDSDFQAHN